MGVQATRQKTGVLADINVTPTVDVMLVLLIIFMVVAPLLQPKITVALPASKNSEVDPNIIKDGSAVISIPRDGAYYIGTEKVLNKEDIPQRISIWDRSSPRIC